MAFAVACVLSASAAAQQAPYDIVGDAIPAPLGEGRGDAARGAVLIADRYRSLCILCHRGPFGAPHMQGDLAPDLAGVGGRLDAGQIRLRVADIKALNPDSIMPSYFSAAAGERTGSAWRGKTILSAGEVEDLVAYLVTLKD